MCFSPKVIAELNTQHWFTLCCQPALSTHLCTFFLSIIFISPGNFWIGKNNFKLLRIPSGLKWLPLRATDDRRSPMNKIAEHWAEHGSGKKVIKQQKREWELYSHTTQNSHTLMVSILYPTFLFDWSRYSPKVATPPPPTFHALL